jgi:hypothetical protein
VREWQERGLLHFHMLLRVDAPERPSEFEVEHVARTVTARTDDGDVLRFGAQVRAEFMRADGNLARTVWYLTKAVAYLVKDVDTGPTASGAHARAHYGRMGQYTRHVLRCRRCPADRSVPCHAYCHRQWGARSHVVTQSRGRRAWSLVGLTRKAQRNQRAQWAAETADGRDAGLIHGSPLARFTRILEAKRFLESHTTTPGTWLTVPS